MEVGQVDELNKMIEFLIPILSISMSIISQLFQSFVNFVSFARFLSQFSSILL